MTFERVKGALFVLVAGLVIYGAVRAHAMTEWIKDSLLLGRAAGQALRAPVMIDDTRALMIKDATGGQTPVTVAQVLQLIANERGRALAQAAAPPAKKE